MFKFNRFSILIFISLFLIPFGVLAGNYWDGSLLRAKGDIKVYLISNNTKRWISNMEVFNLNNFKWQNVKVVSKKEVAAIKEEAPIILESILPTPPAEQATPTISASLTPRSLPKDTAGAAPIPAKVNPKFPPPDYIRADWLISHTTSNYGRIGQRIVFKYSNKEEDEIENFRLYEKSPGSGYFYKIADFQEVPSTGCEDTDIDGEWMMTEAGQCGYWSVQRIVPPGERNAVAYSPAANYSEGEYAYYIVGVDKDGYETPPSPETKLIFSDPVDILSPADNRQTAGIYPVFKWSIAENFPADSVADYLTLISDDKNAQTPIWVKQLKVVDREGKTEESLVYDGVGLNPAKKYKVYIYGHYRKSEYDPDYISIPIYVPEFWIKPLNPGVSFRGFLKALFLSPFDLWR